MDSVFIHIEDISSGFKSFDEALEKFDKLTKSMTFLKDFFEENDEDDSTTSIQVDGNIIEEIGGKVVAKESWLESTRENLRFLQRDLSKWLKKIKKTFDDELNTFAKMKKAFSSHWGEDALIVACLVWAGSKAGSSSPSVRQFIGTTNFEFGPVGQIFVDNEVSEDLIEAFSHHWGEDVNVVPGFISAASKFLSSFLPVRLAMRTASVMLSAVLVQMFWSSDTFL